MSTAPRRPRRAVRPSGIVGTDESVLHATLPTLPPAGEPPRTVVASTVPDATSAPGGPTGRTAAGDDDLWRATRSVDDSDRGWGQEEPSSNDDRLRREKPPHW